MSRRLQWLLEDLEERQLELLRLRRRLEQQREGVCQCCGRPISARRLKLVDGAVLCTACALLARRSRDLLDPLARRN